MFNLSLSLNSSSAPLGKIVDASTFESGVSVDLSAYLRPGTRYVYPQTATSYAGDVEITWVFDSHTHATPTFTGILLEGASTRVAFDVEALTLPAQMAAPTLTPGVEQVTLAFAAAPAAVPAPSGYAWQVTLATDPTFASPLDFGSPATRDDVTVTGLTAGALVIARTRATNSQGDGEWSEASEAVEVGAETIWTPDLLPGFVALYDAEDASTVTSDGSGITAIAPKLGTGPTLTRTGVAPYAQHTSGVFRGNGTLTGVTGAVSGGLAKAGGYTVGWVGKPGTTTAVQPIFPWIANTSSAGGDLGTPAKNVTQNGSAAFVAVNSIFDGATDYMRMFINGDDLYATASAGFGAATYANFSIFGPSTSVGAQYDVQKVVLIDGEISDDDRQKLEGWLKHNSTLTSAVSLVNPDGSGHPYNVAPPGGASGADPVLGDGLDYISATTTQTVIADGYRATASTNGQLVASERATVTPLAHYRLTGKVKAAAGKFPLIRVGRTAELWSNGGLSTRNAYHDDEAPEGAKGFWVQRQIAADGTAKSFTLDFLAPTGLVHVGVRLPNAISGDEVEITDLALDLAPVTVAIGSNTTATTITHDGVTIALELTGGGAVTVGRYADGSYWALNPGGATALRVTGYTLEGIGASGLTDVSNGYAGYGAIDGFSQSVSITGKKAGGAMLNEISRLYGSPLLTSQGFDERMLATYGTYRTELNVAPWNTGKPIVFDRTADFDWTAESDRISAPTEASLLIEVPEDIPGSSQGRIVTSNYVVLTVVTSAPAAGSFRPPWAYKGAKTPWANVSDAATQIAALPSITTPAEMTAAWLTAADQLEYHLSAPGIVFANVPTAQGYMPRRFGGTYTRERVNSFAQTLYATILDDYTGPEKERIARKIIQLGIDVAGRLSDAGFVPAVNGEVFGVDEFALRFAAAMMPGVSAITDAADVAVSGRRLAVDHKTQRLTQRIIDRRSAASAPSTGRVIPQHIPQAALGLAESSQWNSLSTPDWAAADYGAGFVGTQYATSYRDQDISGALGPMAVMYAVGGVAAWNNPVVMDYFDRMAKLLPTMAAASVGYGDALKAPELPLWKTLRTGDGPASFRRWGLTDLWGKTHQGWPMVVPVIRPLRPGQTGTWLDLAAEEFGSGFFAGGLPTSYAVSTTPVAIGEMTTTAGVNSTTLVAGVTLNASTGVITADGSQVAAGLKWFRIVGTNASGSAEAVVALHVADNHLRTVLHTSSLAGSTPMTFAAEVQGASPGGTLWWWAKSAGAFASQAAASADRTPVRPSTADIKAGTGATFSGSVSITANGWAPDITTPAATGGHVYDVSFWWEPSSGAAPDPVHHSVWVNP